MASLTVGVCRERGPGDRLVAVLPASVRSVLRGDHPVLAVTTAVVLQRLR